MPPTEPSPGRPWWLRGSPSAWERVNTGADGNDTQVRFDTSRSNLRELRGNIAQALHDAAANVDDAPEVARAPADAAITPAVESDLEKLSAVVTEFLERMDHVLERVSAQYLPVVSQLVASERWTEQVMRPVSDTTTDIDRFASIELHDWQDIAAHEYKTTVRKQQGEAVEAFVERARYVSQWLDDVAVMNVEFMRELVEVATAIYRALTDLVSATAGIVPGAGLARAVSATLDLIGTLHQDGIDRLAAAFGRITEVLTDRNELERRRLDHGPFPGGAWPEAAR